MPKIPGANIIESQYLNDIPNDRETLEKEGEYGGYLGQVYKEKYAGDENVIGIGGERLVISDGDEAVAFKYVGDKYSALTTYYTQRILHTLYPDNFPRFKAVYYAEDQNVNVEFRDRVEFSEEYPIEDPNIHYIEDISDELHEMGVKISGGICAFGGENLYTREYRNVGLVTNEQGDQNEVFLDAVRPGEVHLSEWDYQKLYTSMKEKGYERKDIKSVLGAALRMATLAQEKLEKLETGEENDYHVSYVRANVVSMEQRSRIQDILHELRED